LTATLETGACDRRNGSCTIAGVVDDSILGPLRSGAPPTVYFPLAQSAALGPPGRTTIAVSVRAAAESPASLAPAVGEALSQFNRRLSFSIRPLERDVTAAVTRERVLATLSSFFGALALLLSGLGLYGLTAHAATQRRPEIGIRLALGATRASVVRLVVARTLTLTAAGLVAGIVGSLWASRLVSSLLFGVEPRHPATIAVAGMVLLAVASLASALPAVRASRTDPANALREA
jgi:ABC-type antimicrobial peptide transport system permease subunit